MARNLLFRTLNSIFGDFVEGLSEENLKVGVWKGDVTLRDLKLNPEGLKKLNLPVDIKHGVVGTFSVHIPWSRLMTESVRIEIHDVYAVAEPHDPSAWDPEDLRKKSLEAKRMLIERTLEAALQAQHAKRQMKKRRGKQQGNYFTRLAIRIVDNIFVSVKNVHIRFEDPVSDPNGLFTLGVILREFQVQTTDETGSAEGDGDTQKEQKRQGGVTHKRADVSDFAVYWNLSGQSRMGDLPPDEFKSKMLKYVDPSDPDLPRDTTYVIPPQSLAIKFVHNTARKDMPVFSGEVDIPTLEMDIQAEQYQQAMAIKSTFDVLTRRQLLLPYRPKRSPKEDPKAWWHYAYFCVKKPRKDVGLLEVLQLLSRKKRYMILWRKKLLNERQQGPPLTEDETKELDAIEEQTPASSLVVWRRLAHRAVYGGSRKKKKRSSRDRKGTAADGDDADDPDDDDGEDKQSWGDWWSSLWPPRGFKKLRNDKRTPDDDVNADEPSEDMACLLAEEEGDASIDELLSEAQDEPVEANSVDLQEEAQMEGQELFRVALRSNAVVKLMGHKREPLLELTTRIQMRAAQKGDKLSASLELPDLLSVKDMRTHNAVFTHIAKPSEVSGMPDQNEALFKADVTIDSTQTCVCVRSHALDVCVNPTVIGDTVALYTPPPEVTQAVINRATENINQASSAATALLSGGGMKLYVDVEINAPRVLLPVHETQDKGLLLLDTGRLTFKGGTLADKPSSTAWEARLQDIHAVVHDTVSKVSKEAKSRVDRALIEPFEVSVSVMMEAGAGEEAVGAHGSSSSAATSVVVELIPAIKGTITPTRVKRLIAVALNMSSITSSSSSTEASQRYTEVGGEAAKRLQGIPLLNREDSVTTTASTTTSHAADAPEEEEEKDGDTRTPPRAAQKGVRVESEDGGYHTAEEDENLGEGGEAGAVPSPSKTDRPNPKKLELRVDIPQVCLELQDDKPGERLFAIMVDKFNLEMNMRALDSHLEVVLGSLSIQNLAQLDHQAATDLKKYLVRSFASDSDDVNNDGKVDEDEGGSGLVHVAMTLNHDTTGAQEKEDAYDRVLDVVFQRLVVAPDADSIRLFKPFVQAAAEAMASYQNSDEDHRGAEERRSETSESTIASTSQRLQEATHGPSMLIKAKLSRVVVEAISSATGQPVIMAQVAGLHAELRQKGALEADVELRTFEVVDVQPSSSDNAVTQLIGAKHGMQHQGSVEKPLLSAQLREDANTHMYNIDVLLEDFTTNVLVEAIMATVNVSLEVTDVVLDLLSCLTPPAPPDTPTPTPTHDAHERAGRGEEEEVKDEKQHTRAVHQRRVQGKEDVEAAVDVDNIHQTGVSLSIKLRLVGMGLVLVENARNNDSRAISMRGTFEVDFLQQADPAEQDISLRALGLEMWIGIMGSDTKKRQIVDPFSVNTHLLRSVDGNMDVTAELDKILATVAYHDVLLALAIFNGLMEAVTLIQEEQQALSHDDEEDEDERTDTDSTSASTRTLTDTASSVEDEEEDQVREKAEEYERGAWKGSVIKASVELGGVDVVFINDYGGRQQPVLSFDLDKVHASAKVCVGDVMGIDAEGKIRVGASFFNPSLVAWEPLIEHWTAAIHAGNPSPSECPTGLKLSVWSDRVLDVDVTEELLQTLGRTYSLLLHSDEDDHYGDDQGNQAGYVLQNLCGVEVEVCMQESRKRVCDREHTCVCRVCRDGERVPLDMVPMGDRRMGSVVKQAQVVLALKGELEGKREAVTGLRLDTPGTFVYPLRPSSDILKQSGGCARLYGQSVEDEVFENERSTLHLGQWTWQSPFLPTDRPRWSNEEGTQEKKPEDVGLPGPGWRWLTDWHVDMTYGVVGQEIDKDGWTYGVGFPGFHRNRAKRTYREMDGVRRRRWIRRRTPAPADLYDPCRPLEVAWEVDLQPDGRKVVTVCSTVRLVNHTPVPLEVEAALDVDKPPVAVGRDPVPAEGKSYLPLLYTHATHLRMRPWSEEKQQSLEGRWSDLFLIDRGAGKYEEVLMCPLPDNINRVCTERAVTGGAAVIVQVESVSGGITQVSFRPPVVVENYLPCKVCVEVRPSPSDSAEKEEQEAHDDVIEATVEAGCKLGLLSKAPASVAHEVRVHMEQYGLSLVSSKEVIGGPQQAMKQTHRFTMRSKADDEDVPHLCVSGCVEKSEDSTHTCVLTLWSRCWVVDRTGLALRFCEDPKQVKKGKAKALTLAPEPGSSRALESSPAPVGPVVAVKDLQVNEKITKGSYKVVAVDNGSRIYTDRPFVFSKLPPRLRRKMCIQTPNNDRDISADSLVTFRLTDAADLYLLYDVSGWGKDESEKYSPPAWVSSQGFSPVECEDMPIVHVNTYHRTEGVIKFKPYHRRATADDVITLGGNATATGSRNNYVVFVVKAPETSDFPQDVGVAGGAGVLMFDPLKQKMCVGLLPSSGGVCARAGVCGDEGIEGKGDKDIIWSKSVDVSSPVDRGVFEVGGLDMAVTVHVCPGAFARTKTVTVMPRFCIVNCLDTDILLRQAGDQSEGQVLTTQSRCPFYWSYKGKGMHREMQVKIPGLQSAWSIGGIDIENAGSTALLLPTTDESGEPLVLHAEVRVASGGDECGVVVALWRPGSPHYVVHNITRFDVQVMQAEKEARLVEKVGTGDRIVYGWEKPSGKHTLLVSVGERRVEVDLDKVGEPPLKLEMEKGRVYLRVIAEGGSKVLKIAEHSRDVRTALDEDDFDDVEDSPKKRRKRHRHGRDSRKTKQKAANRSARKDVLGRRKEQQDPPALLVEVDVAGVGLSLVGTDKQEGRREIGYVLASHIVAQVAKGAREAEVEVRVDGVQIDNHVPRAAFPVAFAAKDPLKKMKKEGDTDEVEPFIHMAVVAHLDEKTHTFSTIRYLGFRMLAADVMLDLRSLMRFLRFFQHIELLDFERATAELDPARYLHNVREFYAYAEPVAWVDVVAMCESVQRPKFYIQELALHPISLSLSFVQTVADDTRMGFIGGNLLEVVKNFATINRAPIKMRSFVVNHALESPDSLMQIVANHYIRQAIGQVLAIAGSLATLGSPVNLVMNVGTGVKDFFYEPAQGLVKSPKAFVKGVGKGTSSLVKGVVSGALNSVAGVGDAVNRQVALLTADRDFQAKREERRQSAQTSGTGVISGLAAGGGALVEGVKDGVAGVVKLPYREEKAGGVVGLVKGAAKGALGVAVKPVVGLGDCVISTIEGASQAAAGVVPHQHARPRRALPRLPDGKKILTEYDAKAAELQAQVVESGDSYVSHVTLINGDCVVFTDKYVMMVNETGRVVWRHAWGNIAYAKLTPQGISMHLYEHDEPLDLGIEDPKLRKEVYKQLLQHSSKMGSGASMAPLPDDDDNDHDQGDATDATRASSSSPSTAVGDGQLEGYVFGSHNDQVDGQWMCAWVYGLCFCCTRGRDADILDRARDRLMNVGVERPWRTWADLDNILVRLIADWTQYHRGLIGFRRCLVALIINQTSSSLQLRDIVLERGSRVRVLETQAYDKASRTLMAPNMLTTEPIQQQQQQQQSQGGRGSSTGAGGGRPGIRKTPLVLFAWSRPRTLSHALKGQHVHLRVDTSAFSANLFTDPAATPSVDARPGYQVSFLEMTRKHSYAKYVILVRDA